MSVKFEIQTFQKFCMVKALGTTFYEKQPEITQNPDNL